MHSFLLSYCCCSMLSFVCIINAKYSEWEIVRPYCEIAPVKCSHERNDEAFMPYHNTSRCYCDYFCFRHEEDHDCCPDFEYVCQPTSTSDFPVHKHCEWNGRQYKEDSSVLDDCNSCTCIDTETGPQWFCDHDLCANNNQLIDAINKTGQWWASVYNRWSNLKYKVMKTFTLGTILDNEEKLRLDNYNYRDPDASIYSFRPPQQWTAKHSMIVRDQGKCGSSWALSAIDVASDRLFTNENFYQLSVQYVLSCSRPEAKKGCLAGRVDYAWGFLKDFGSPAESDYPYESGRTGLVGYCASKKNLNDPLFQTIEQFSPAYRVSSDPLIIKHELYTRGPVQATFLVCPDFYQYKGGIYSRTWTGSESLCDYHSVRLIGWGHSVVNGEEIEYWICLNSWGTEWGENGRFKIKIGDSEINKYIISTWGRSSAEKINRVTS